MQDLRQNNQTHLTFNPNNNFYYAVIEQSPQAVLRFFGEHNAPGRGQHITPAGGHVGTVLHRVKEKTLDGAHPADIDQRHRGLRKKALSLQVALQSQIAVCGLPLHLLLKEGIAEEQVEAPAVFQGIALMLVSRYVTL